MMSCNTCPNYLFIDAKCGNKQSENYGKMGELIPCSFHPEHSGWINWIIMTGPDGNDRKMEMLDKWISFGVLKFQCRIFCNYGEANDIINYIDCVDPWIFNNQHYDIELVKGNMVGREGESLKREVLITFRKRWEE